jgi:antitoxin YefM
MNVVSFTEAQANLEALLDAVCRDQAPTTIKREHGEDVVVLTRSEFGSMEETLYLLGTENNARNLRESIAQFKAGQIVRHEPFLNGEQKGAEPTIGQDFRHRLG